jgi:hypothetical protein
MARIAYYLSAGQENATSFGCAAFSRQNGGIVDKPEEYLYSSARDYYGLSGLIDIILVEPMIGWPA